jgi:hypothetical protein
VTTIEALLHPRTTLLPGYIQSSYLQAVLKIFIRAANDCSDDNDLLAIMKILRTRIVVFLMVIISLFLFFISFELLIMLSLPAPHTRVPTLKFKKGHRRSLN